jgi:hypothetical protein
MLCIAPPKPPVTPSTVCNRRSARRQLIKASREYVTVCDVNRCHSLTLCMSGKTQPRNNSFSPLPASFRQAGPGSGAKGTRTPDPLLANNGQAVYQRPYPQVTFPGCPSASAGIHPCCGTSVLCPAQDQGTVPRGTTQATNWPVTCAMSS